LPSISPLLPESVLPEVMLTAPANAEAGVPISIVDAESTPR
jgi:hypothetical protein